MFRIFAYVNARKSIKRKINCYISHQVGVDSKELSVCVGRQKLISLNSKFIEKVQQESAVSEINPLAGSGRLDDLRLLLGRSYFTKRNCPHIFGHQIKTSRGEKITLIELSPLLLQYLLI